MSDEAVLVRKEKTKRRSVHLLGYDVADHEWQAEQKRFQAVLQSLPKDDAHEAPTSPVRRGSLGTLLKREEHDANLRRALCSKLQSVDGSFSHKFEAATLGFSLSLARYGDEGRKFLQVDATRPGCALYPDILKPHDELVAVDDVLVVSADVARFREVLRLLANAPRPVKLTFLEGEGRDLAFQVQEADRRKASRRASATRAVSASDPAPPTSPASPSSPSAPRHRLSTLSRLTDVVDLDAIQESFAVYFIKEDHREEASAAERRPPAPAVPSLPWCSVSCFAGGGGAPPVVETPYAELRRDV